MTESRRLLSPSEIHPALGFSHVTIAGSGRTAYLAGPVALDSSFQVVGGDVAGCRASHDLHAATHRVRTPV